MKAHEIRELSAKEREEQVADLRQEYFNLKFQLATGKIENPSRLRLIRRDVARIRTIQQELDETGESPQGAGRAAETKKGASA